MAQRADINLTDYMDDFYTTIAPYVTGYLKQNDITDKVVVTAITHIVYGKCLLRINNDQTLTRQILIDIIDQVIKMGNL